MAKSFDALVKRTTTKAFRARAATRTKELLAELPVSELRGSSLNLVGSFELAGIRWGQDLRCLSHGQSFKPLR